MNSARNPSISFLVPAYNTPLDVLEEMILSVENQTSPHWELCIIDDASPDGLVQDFLDTYRGKDPRIKILFSEKNLHIAAATNAAAEYATGDFVAFLDHDDTVAPEATQRLTDLIQSDPEIDFIYTDEDKLEADGSPSESYFKPDFSPEHLYSVAYTLHLMAIRKSLYLELGGLRAEYSGAQDYDLALRATRLARRVCHIPGVLYHWRKIAGSAAAVVDAKPDALRRARAALADVVALEDPEATVVDGRLPGTFRVRWHIDRNKPVTLVIATNCASKDVDGRGHICLVENAVRSIKETSTYENIEVMVVHNSNIEEDLAEKLRSFGVRLEGFRLDGDFNFSKKINYALSLVQTEDVIILNDDIEVISPGWIEAMLEMSNRQGVGVVGARLLYPNGLVQHQGVVLGVMGNSTHIFHNLDRDAVGYNGYTHLIRNYSAVTGAVLATKMSILEKADFFDEKLAIDYNDIDLCLRIGDLGYRIVYTPYAELFHFEGSSLKRSFVNKEDDAIFSERWKHKIDCDPFYNRFLPRGRGDCSMSSW